MPLYPLAVGCKRAVVDCSFGPEQKRAHLKYARTLLINLDVETIFFSSFVFTDTLKITSSFLSDFFLEFFFLISV